MNLARVRAAMGGPTSCTFGFDLETRLAINCRKLDSYMIRDVEVRLGTVTITVIAIVDSSEDVKVAFT